MANSAIDDWPTYADPLLLAQPSMVKPCGRLPRAPSMSRAHQRGSCSQLGLLSTMGSPSGVAAEMTTFGLKALGIINQHCGTTEECLKFQSQQ